jgi:amidase
VPGERSDELCFKSATELAGLVRRREVSARELLDAHVDRIERVNPAINAIVTLDVEGARTLAAAADERTVRAGQRGERLGPLHGLPAVHKDTHLTAGMRTTFGSPLHADFVPDTDQLIVARLAAAGVVRLGKTNTPEFAAGSHTFNPVFGATRNPYRKDVTAGGSSGGAAAALAARLVPVAEGSDLGGSLRNPAAFCNVVGLRPSLGRVPSYPATQPWTTLSVPGPLGRTVADTALVLSAIAGPDHRVPGSLAAPGSAFAPPLPDVPRGLRVAWAPDLGGRIPVDQAVRDVLAAVPDTVTQELGASVQPACPDLAAADEVFDVFRAWHFLTSHGAAVREHPDQVKQTIQWNVARGARLSAADLGRAEVLRAELHGAVVSFFESYDILLAPTTQVPPFDIDIEYPTEVDGTPQPSYVGWMRSCSLISATGCPAMSVPAGFTADGLPVGLQVVAAPGADAAVLAFGHAYEQATGWAAQLPSQA